MRTEFAVAVVIVAGLYVGIMWMASSTDRVPVLGVAMASAGTVLALVTQEFVK